MRLITETMRQMRAAKDRFDVGEVTLTDVSVAEARLAAASAGLAAAQGRRWPLRRPYRYKAAIGGYPANLRRWIAQITALPKSLDAGARAISIRRGIRPILQSQAHGATAHRGFAD
ncbi:MAG: hypothetical protein U5N55_09405 [Cypionkella sp.]|nr:hypothetical protein [Cypionkella sp.]